MSAAYDSDTEEELDLDEILPHFEKKDTAYTKEVRNSFNKSVEKESLVKVTIRVEPDLLKYFQNLGKHYNIGSTTLMRYGLMSVRDAMERTEHNTFDDWFTPLDF